MSLLDIIPDYREALVAEQFRRDAAFLPVAEQIAGFALRPVRLRDYVALRLCRSPFLVATGSPAQPQDVANFLWLLSPDYVPGVNPVERQEHARRCRRIFFPRSQPRWLRFGWMCRDVEAANARRFKNFSAIVTAIEDFVENTMADGVCAGGATGASYYSDAAGICGLLAREYGWSEEAVLDLPLTRIWQYLNEIKRSHGAKVSLNNPSDHVRARWLASINHSRAS